MDLVRQILLDIEGGKTGFEISDIDDEGEEVPEPEATARRALEHHLHIMEGAGLLTVHAWTNGACVVERLTWEGHDLLDSVRDPEVWKETKSGLSKVGGWTVDLMKDAAKAYLKMRVKDVLGLDI